MLKSPVPDILLDSIYCLGADMLVRAGVKLLFLDLDNTLVPYGTAKSPVSLRNWIDALKKAGVEPFILSNNKGNRPRHFAGELSLEYVGAAGKPSVKKLQAVLDKKGVSPEKTAIIGDQIYTDVLCGKRAGILTIAVRPIRMRNPILLLRYGLEYPFRRAGKNKATVTKKEKFYV